MKKRLSIIVYIDDTKQETANYTKTELKKSYNMSYDEAVYLLKAEAKTTFDIFSELFPGKRIRVAFFDDYAAKCDWFVSK